MITPIIPVAHVNQSDQSLSLVKPSIFASAPRDQFTLRFGLKDKPSGPFSPGTAGIRPGRALTEEEAISIANAYATYALDIDNNPQKLPVIVAKDTRPNSAAMFDIVIKTLLARGLDVVYFDKPLPTPILSYTLANQTENNKGKQRFFGALVLTASHNPYQQGGCKFLMADGTNANAAITTDIINQTNQYLHDRTRPDLNFSNVQGQKTSEDFKTNYFTALKKQFDFPRIARNLKQAGITILLDTHYGAGYCLAEFLQQQGLPIEIQRPPKAMPNGYNGHSEPILENLAATIAEATQREQNGEHIMIAAIDGDGDRGGLGTGQGMLANEDIVALLMQLAVQKKQLGTLVMNQGSSTYVRVLAKELGLLQPGEKALITPIGWKHIGKLVVDANKAHAKDPTQPRVALGLEPNNGGATSGYYFLPDKDAAFPICSVLALAAKQIEQGQYTNLPAMCKELRDRTPTKFYTEEYALIFPSGNNSPSRTMSALGELRDTGKLPTEFVGMHQNLSIDWDKTQIHRDDLLKDYGTTDGVKLFFKNPAGQYVGWLLARPSGTEAALRIHIEGSGDASKTAALNARAIHNALVNFLYDNVNISFPKTVRDLSPIDEPLGWRA